MKLKDRVRIKRELCLGDEDSSALGTIIEVCPTGEFLLQWDDGFEDSDSWSEDELELLPETC